MAIRGARALIRERSGATLERLGYPRIEEVEVPSDPCIDVWDGVVDGLQSPARTPSDDGVGA